MILEKKEVINTIGKLIEIVVLATLAIVCLPLLIFFPFMICFG